MTGGRRTSQRGAAGKIALVRGLASPGRAWAAQQAGTLGQIWVLMDHLHNMIVTTVWGTPAPETASRIPATPCLSILGVDGERLRARLASGPLRLRMTTRVRTGWMPIPHLVGELVGREEDRFVLFSGHVDSWHYGAMDNGTANATMLEVARLLAARRSELRRGIRFAFWSGHSHGRYAGSAWYADHAWRELHQRCILHLNVDSTGARGATDYSVLHATEDAQRFAEAVVADVTGQPSRGRRFSRAGDQSFWGAGVPSAFMSLSGLPKQDTDLSRAMERLVGSAGFPWWWHTKDDTIDKIDPDVLVLDTKVYVASALRWLNAPVLPLDHARAAQALLGELEALQAAAGARFDLAPALEAARTLGERLERVAAGLEAVDPSTPPARREAINRGLMRLSRVLVPLAYTSGDRFTHDLALPIPPLAGLQRARELARLDPDSDGYKFARAALVRERNRAVHALDSAASVADELIALERQEIAHAQARLTSADRALGAGVRVGTVPPADAQKRGGTLTIVRPTDPVSLDPNLETTAPGAWVYFNMLEGLLTLDDKMQVKPSLATSYEVMSPTKVRFKLRPEREVPRRHARSTPRP